MAHYLVQVAYTPEAWAAMVKNPQDRTEAIRPAIEQLGGRVETVYLAFGDYDLISIIEFPDNVSSAAFALAASAGGACKSLKTTPLLTAAEGIDAMKQASDLGYKPPK